MKVTVFAMPTVPATVEERIALRPIGRNPERYQAMVEELRTLAKLADEHGITAFGTTEHHFHTEGGEGNPNPLLMFSHLAGLTKDITFIPLSIVLSAEDPLRVAENVALFDHLYPGRVAVGFARGYQKRWIQVLTQGRGAAAWEQEDSGDARNRAIFNDHLNVVLKAWDNDVFDYDGVHYQVPFPHDEGVRGWAAPDWTRRYGAEGEIDDEGVIRKIGTVPPMFTKKRPEMFMPFGISQETLRTAVEHDMTLMLAEGRPQAFADLCSVYRDECAKLGKPRRLGAKIAAVRSMALGDTTEEAFDIATRTMGYEWQQYFSLFGGFTEAFRTDADDPDKPVLFADEAACTRRLMEVRHGLVGTPDEVKFQLDELHKIHGDGELEWFVWNFFSQGIMPPDVWKKQLELFVEKVWPAFQ